MWQRVRLGAMVLSAALLAVLCACHLSQADAVAFVTVWPFWGWLPFGLWVLLIGHGHELRRFWHGVLLAWLLAAVVFCDEVPGLLRHRAAPTRGLRVVTLNCAGGQIEAAAEALTYEPDIVLLQETPGGGDLARLGREWTGRDGCVLVGHDGSVLARGTVTPLPPEALHYTMARVRLDRGPEIVVVSLRLSPVPVSLRLWSSRERGALNENRRRHRREMAEIAERLRELPPGTPVIAGGDFNAPGRDAVCRLLAPWCRDTWPMAGVGWGNTIINDVPMSRIDQIQVSRHFRALRVRAVQTASSDHRLVITELDGPS